MKYMLLIHQGSTPLVLATQSPRVDVIREPCGRAAERLKAPVE